MEASATNIKMIYALYVHFIYSSHLTLITAVTFKMYNCEANTHVHCPTKLLETLELSFKVLHTSPFSTERSKELFLFMLCNSHCAFLYD